MSMAGLTSTSRKHGDGRAYDHCGTRESPFLKPQNFANTIGKPRTNDEPDTIDFAKQIVKGYGYTDPSVLALRSRRAHSSSQYLKYDYGLAMYTNLIEFLQAGVGPEPRVDAYLLQACGMPSPKKDQAAIDKLSACIRART